MREITTAAEWITALDEYMQLVSTQPRKARLLRAQLDGSWCRLRGPQRAAMNAAVEQVNTRLLPEQRIGLRDALTGEAVGVLQVCEGLQPANHP